MIEKVKLTSQFFNKKFQRNNIIQKHDKCNSLEIYKAQNKYSFFFNVISYFIMNYKYIFVVI